MKTNSNSIFLALFTLATLNAFSGAQAAPINATLTHNSYTFVVNSSAEANEDILYSCDSVEHATTDLLEKLGATHVSANCFGSATDVPVFSPTVSVTFDSLRLPTSGVQGTPTVANWAQVHVNGTDNCHLTEEILRGADGHFDFQGTNSFSCMDPDGGYRYSITTLAPR